nr:MAG TPA: hypothetical protein [Caudoviricetes sp.]
MRSTIYIYSLILCIIHHYPAFVKYFVYLFKTVF